MTDAAPLTNATPPGDNRPHAAPPVDKTEAPSATREGLRHRYRRSLSFKLFALTIVCVLIAELVVLVPSIANRRISFLKDRVEAAYIVGLALNSDSGAMIDEAEMEQLFATAGILGVVLTHSDGARELIKAPALRGDGAGIRHFVDMTDGWSIEDFAAPWMTLGSRGDNLVQVSGKARYGNDDVVDVILSQAAMRRDLIVYTRNVFLLSLLISSLTAFFVYTRLDRTLVAPVKSLSTAMMAFEDNPEDPRNIAKPSKRGDELGVAERSLADLQERVQALLSERRRLAALGSGISKISHDLRNILASAQLMSDRLAKSDDPRVAKLAPRLISALDRAVALSRDTLSYARMAPETLKKKPVNLHDLMTDVFEDAASMHVALKNETPDDLVVNADPHQLYRAFFNLVKNAVEAMTSDASEVLEALDAPSAPVTATFTATVTATARHSADAVFIEIADNGPGLPEAAQSYLFEPFKGSQKPGGTGLGVAIAGEVLKAHGGALRLLKSDAAGATFEARLPTRNPSID
ncbi:MAG: HAMP domain-containing sensor histidine kinase [Pseudomonadota bacterium]